MRKLNDPQILLLCVLVVVVGLLAVIGLSTLLEPKENGEWEAEPEYENSMYVGHFDPYTELRRIDDHEVGNVCYKVIGQQGLSCVPMPEVKDETLRRQE